MKTRRDRLKKYNPGTEKVTASSCSAWLVQFPNHSLLLVLKPKNSSIEGIIKIYLDLGNKEFTVQRLDTGEFQISKAYICCSKDSRRITQDLKVYPAVLGKGWNHAQ